MEAGEAAATSAPQRLCAGGASRLGRAAPVGLLLVGLFLAFAPVLELFSWSVDFGDEMLRPVLGHLMREGHRLYADAWAMQGPLSFATSYLSTFVDAALDTDPRPYRAWNALLLALACWAIARSALHWTRARGLASMAVAFVALLAASFEHWLHLHYYHAVGGFLASMALSLWVLPAVLGSAPGRSAILGGGIAAGLLVVSSYTHGLFLVLAAGAAALAPGGERAWAAPGIRRLPVPLRSPASVAVVALGTVAAFFALTWPVIDPVEWLHKHVLFTLDVYARYLGFRPDPVALLLGPWLPGGIPPASEYVSPGLRRLDVALVVATALAFAAAAVKAGAQRGWAPMARVRAVLAIALVFVALPTLSPRGIAVFRGAPFVAAAITAAVLIFSHLLPARAKPSPMRPRRALACAALVAACLVGTVGVLAGWWPLRSPPALLPARFLEQRVAYWKRVRGPDSNRALRRRLARYLGPDDRLVALIYRPQDYLRAGRLPLFPYYFHYLPWHAEYARREGRPSLAELVARARPAVLLFDDWTVWGRYRLADYAPELAARIASDYRRVGDTYLYVRRDLP